MKWMIWSIHWFFIFFPYLFFSVFFSLNEKWMILRELISLNNENNWSRKWFNDNIHKHQLTQKLTCWTKNGIWMMWIREPKKDRVEEERRREWNHDIKICYIYHFHYIYCLMYSKRTRKLEKEKRLERLKKKEKKKKEMNKEKEMKWRHFIKRTIMKYSFYSTWSCQSILLIKQSTVISFWNFMFSTSTDVFHMIVETVIVMWLYCQQLLKQMTVHLLYSFFIRQFLKTFQ